MGSEIELESSIIRGGRDVGDVREGGDSRSSLLGTFKADEAPSPFDVGTLFLSKARLEGSGGGGGGRGGGGGGGALARLCMAS